MQSIVIATDGSPSAREAVEFGLQLAAEQSARVTFVTVAPAVDVLPVSNFGGTAGVAHELTEEDEAPLDQARELAEEAGVHVHTRLLKGDAAAEIVAFADDVDADVIVVGSRDQGALASAFLGSVSREVLRDAHRPVLVARGVSNHAAAAA
jgi:nucleotide-binding universal stress UspA family protein